jgi:formylglycine-generating enzyme required for sulfatase activity
MTLTADDGAHTIAKRKRSKEVEKIMKRYPLLILVCLFLAASPAFGSSPAFCQDKVLDEGSVGGIYRGVECGDFRHATIELATGEMFSMLAGEEELEKIFGPGTGQKVSVAYRVQQFWNEYSGGDCARIEVMASGRLLAAAPAGQKAAQAPVPQKAAPSPTSGEKTFTNSIGMEFVLIPAGPFAREAGKNEFNEPVRAMVTISKPFYLGKYEVTQEQWVAVMGSNPSGFKGRTNPVDSVSWNDTQEFIKRLNAKEGHSRYRLPTEAEWEYAARGGTDTMFFFMKNPKTWEEAASALDAYAWFKQNSGKKTHPVGEKKPNPLGLYDVYGNVNEWVQDWYTKKLPTDREITDYKGPGHGSYRVSRGGGWIVGAEGCRSSYRDDILPPGDRSSLIGFRLALSPK